MLFLTSELAKKAEINILLAWDTAYPRYQASALWASSDLIRTNNQQLMYSFNGLLQDIREFKGSKEDSVEQQLKDIKKLKFSKPYKDQSGKATWTSLRSTLN